MSRVVRRSGTKALVCQHCVRLCKDGKNARNAGSFRGTSQARLDRHVREVHQNPRAIRPRFERTA